MSKMSRISRKINKFHNVAHKYVPMTVYIVSMCRPMQVLLNALRGKFNTRLVLDKSEF